MSENAYLNLRFINVVQGIRATPFSAAEMFSASHIRQSEVLAYAGRLFRQDRVGNYRELQDYLISIRDVNAWKIGVFRFFYSYYCAHPTEISYLNPRQDATKLEQFIDNLEISPLLADYYHECGHDPHQALKYSVSKIICNEHRLGWMNTFCAKFKSLLDFAADTGIVAKSLLMHIDLIEAAYGLGIINNDERDELLNIHGKRIATMFDSWGKFMAGVLLSNIYELTLSAAEIRYLPKKVQEIIDGYYLCCNNDLVHNLPIPGWEKNDLADLKEALRPLVNAQKLDNLWNNADPKELATITMLTKAFNFYQEKLWPVIRNSHIASYFAEFGKFDEFISIVHGFDFKVYVESLRIPLATDELPLFIMRFCMFTTKGIWSFGAYHERTFTPWPAKISVEECLPTNRDYGSVILPFYIPELDCDISIQLPARYRCDSTFINMTAMEQAKVLAQDIAGLKVFFSSLPYLVKS